MCFFNKNYKKITKKLILLYFLLPNILLAADENIVLPDFGDSSGGTFSPSYERRLSQMFLKQIRRFSTINTDPEVELYIQSLGYNLVSNSDNAKQSFKFMVINDPSINAFAGPGGIIGINSGVILHSGTESELAGVVAHEIAHVTQKHLARAFEEAKRYSLPTAAAMIGAIIMATQNPSAGQAMLSGITGLNTQNQINFTRENEKEADRIGIKLLEKSGYNPRGMPQFFEKLQKISKFSQNNHPEFFRTHPLTTSRIADARSRAESYTKKQFENSHAYELVRYKLLVQTIEKPKEAILFLRNKLEENKDGAKKELYIRYGLAYAYLADNAFAHSNQQIKHLLKNNAKDPAYLLLAAKHKTTQSKYDDALNIYSKIYGLYPEHKPMLMAYARALMDIGKAEEARKIIKNYERYHSHDLNSYALLGQIEGMLGNEIETAILQSEFYYLSGETKLAIEKLKFIKQQFNMNYYQEQRVIARLIELQYELDLENDIKL
ncbi:MAG: M48 family metalloprotease [Gammaproteobacteria bacterium]